MSEAVNMPSLMMMTLEESLVRDTHTHTHTHIHTHTHTHKHTHTHNLQMTYDFANKNKTKMVSTTGSIIFRWGHGL